jgi:hypothetical protein
MLKMSDDYRLNDIELATFVTNGYLSIHLDDIPDVHRTIADAFSALDHNPGDHVVDDVPELTQIMEHPRLAGAMKSILGENFEFNTHRHWHCKPPGSGYMHWHQDGLNNRDHSISRCLALYYPEDVTADMGPTVIVPGTHFRNAPTDRMAHYFNIRGQVPMVVPAGTVAITHYDLWHGTCANTSSKQRHMMKFLANRKEPNAEPNWNHDPDWETASLDWNHKTESVRQILTFGNPLRVSQSDTYKERHIRSKCWNELLGRTE